MNTAVIKPGRGTKVTGRRTGCDGPADTGKAAEQRCRMIAEAAYFRAMERGFTPGQEIDDWLQAEQDIDRTLLRPSGR